MKKERKKQIEKEYDSEFVNTILESKKQIENGNSKVIKTEDLWK
jgi:hypothetical protein